MVLEFGDVGRSIFEDNRGVHNIQQKKKSSVPYSMIE